MKPFKNTFFTFLGLASLGIFAFVSFDLYQENERVQKIKGVDAKVISQLNKLKLIQEAHLSINKRFCGSWEEMETFVKTQSFVLTQTKETIEMVDGKDKVTIAIDTLGTISVFDSLKSELRLNDISEVPGLWKVPVSDTTFTIRADKLGNGQPICEMRDPAPLNPKRNDDGSLSPLQIGSLELSTLQGNWE